MMTAKHLIVFIITLFAVDLAFAQLQFEPERFDFGTLEELGGKRSCTFRATNHSAKPVVLVDIVTTCGCTVPTFSRQPILPGKSAEIEVSYDPEGRPGAFDRKLHIYGAGRERLGVISITGQVTPRPRSIEELYPIELSDGVRLNTTRCTFTYLYVGRTIASAISVVNTSDKPRRLQLRAKKASGLLQVEYPEVLQPGERSAINFSYTIPIEQPRYGSVRDVWEVFIEEKASEKILLAHGIAVDPPKKSAQGVGPKVEISENILKFGAVKHDAPPANRQLSVRNIGTEELIIRSVECDAPFEVQLPADCRLSPREAQTIQVRLRPREGEYGFVTGQLLLVTSDSERPLRRIRVNATIEE